MSHPSPITSAHVLQAQTEPQKAGPEKKAAPPEPSKGQQAAHSLYRKQSFMAHAQALFPHIVLLRSPQDRSSLAVSLLKLKSIAKKCERKLPLTPTEWRSAYLAKEMAEALIKECKKNLDEHAGVKAAGFDEHISRTEALLEAVFNAVQTNRATIPRARL